MEKLFDVIEVQIAEPHTERVIAEGLTEKNADATVLMAVARRGYRVSADSKCGRHQFDFVGS